MLTCLLLGFSSGLPLFVVYQLIPAWLREHGTSLQAIGLFSLLTLPYALKFLWAPLSDRYAAPWVERRLGWGLVLQLVLAMLITACGWLDPQSELLTVAGFTVALCFVSASQDIVLDAYRRELLSDRELGLGNALFVNAYRVSALVPGGLALILADRLPWSVAFAVTGAFMAIGCAGVLLGPKTHAALGSPRTLREAVVGPLREFFSRGDVKHAAQLLGFMFLYKLGDSMATALITPFYLDVGFSKTQIGTVVKFVSLGSSVSGMLVGGIVLARIGINRSLWVFGVVQLASILGFAVLAEVGNSVMLLAVVVCFEYLGVGLGTAAFLAFIARATAKQFSATQFALFSSFIALPRSLANATTGYLIEAVGYTTFFLLCTALAVPGMLMLLLVAPWNDLGPSTPKH